MKPVTSLLTKALAGQAHSTQLVSNGCFIANICVVPMHDKLQDQIDYFCLLSTPGRRLEEKVE